MTEILGLEVFGPAGSSDANSMPMAFVIMKEAQEERVKEPAAPNISLIHLS